MPNSLRSARTGRATTHGPRSTRRRVKTTVPRSRPRAGATGGTLLLDSAAGRVPRQRARRQGQQDRGRGHRSAHPHWGKPAQTRPAAPLNSLASPPATRLGTRTGSGPSSHATESNATLVRVAAAVSAAHGEEALRGGHDRHRHTKPCSKGSATRRTTARSRPRMGRAPRRPHPPHSPSPAPGLMGVLAAAGRPLRVPTPAPTTSRVRRFESCRGRLSKIVLTCAESRGQSEVQSDRHYRVTRSSRRSWPPTQDPSTLHRTLRESVIWRNP